MNMKNQFKRTAPAIAPRCWVRYLPPQAFARTPTSSPSATPEPTWLLISTSAPPATASEWLSSTAASTFAFRIIQPAPLSIYQAALTSVSCRTILPATLRTRHACGRHHRRATGASTGSRFSAPSMASHARRNRQRPRPRRQRAEGTVSKVIAGIQWAINNKAPTTSG